MNEKKTNIISLELLLLNDLLGNTYSSIKYDIFCRRIPDNTTWYSIYTNGLYI